MLAGVICVSCTDLGASMEEVEAFPGSAVSLEQLGGGVLRALADADVSALEDLRLTEAEHNHFVWPELPASAPEVNFPVDLAWTNIQTRNRSALIRIVPLYRGRETHYRGTECRGDTERFDSFVVHTDCWVVFYAPDGSEYLEAQIFKDVLVRGGGHKVFRYYDEEPRTHTGEEAD